MIANCGHDERGKYNGGKEGRTLSRAYRVYFVNSQMYTASFAMQNQGSNRQVATFPGVDPILGPEMRSTGNGAGTCLLSCFGTDC